MPKIREITQDLVLVSTQFSDAQDPRSPGIHLSDIIQDLGKSLGYLQEYGGNDDLNVRDSRFTLGFIWENFVGTQMRDTAVAYSSGTIFRPPELTVDGIHMSPDAFDVTLPGLREYKCTSKSMGNDITSDKFWSWWVQIKAYCKGMGVDKSILQVLFLRGDYKDRDGCHQRAWEAEFSPTELDENWSMLINHYNAMKRRQ